MREGEGKSDLADIEDQKKEKKTKDELNKPLKINDHHRFLPPPLLPGFWPATSCHLSHTESQGHSISTHYPLFSPTDPPAKLGVIFNLLAPRKWGHRRHINYFVLKEDKDNGFVEPEGEEE